MLTVSDYAASLFTAKSKLGSTYNLNVSKCFISGVGPWGMTMRIGTDNEIVCIILH